MNADKKEVIHFHPSVHIDSHLCLSVLIRGPVLFVSVSSVFSVVNTVLLSHGSGDGDDGAQGAARGRADGELGVVGPRAV